jgi:predicted Zn finger-like uncharacterized protein
MKISCQSCHSKYNVADEKVQGKIVKIRCRKCGATIVVNASGGASANGSSAAPPSPTSPEGVGEGVAGEWHVSVADNDQRTMTIAELVAAYNAGTVAQDTFVWTEGMGDWKPLSEVDAIVSALHAAAEQAPPPSPAGAYAYGLSAAPAASPSPAFEAPAPVQSRSPVYEGVLAAPAPDPEPRRAAVVKREARARDLFATRSGEELQTSAPLTHAMAPSAASDDSRLTGQRNENSVLFSLDHLTKNAEPSVQPEYGRSKDDSGIIDLKALTAKAESMRPPTLHDSNALSSPLGMAPPLGFAAPLGAPLGGRGSDTQSKSRFPLYLVGGAALLVVLGIVIGLKIGGGTAAPTPVASATAAPTAMPPGTADSVPSATASVAASAAPSPSATAGTAQGAPSVPATPAPVAAGPKPHAYGGGSAFRQAPAAKPAGAAGGGSAGGGGVPAAAATQAAGGGGGGPAASPAPAKKGDCGCNGDLMCMMKCSTH